MMNWGGPEFVLSIMAIWGASSVATTWIRAKHGYELEDEHGNRTPPPDRQANQKLATENAELREQLEHFADRVKVLERIVTDKGISVASQIEALRDAPQLEERK